MSEQQQEAKLTKNGKPIGLLDQFFPIKAIPYQEMTPEDKAVVKQAKRKLAMTKKKEAVKRRINGGDLNVRNYRQYKSRK